MEGMWTTAGPRAVLVVDANVAVKFVTEEPGSEAAYEVAIGPEPLIAPDWLLVEAASVMWKKVKRSNLLEIHAEENLAVLPEFFARLFPVIELLADALQLSFRTRHPVYDCLYLALAIREQADLVTADRKFYQAIQDWGNYDRARLLEW
jgi:predicted nucleic acid-binding protein